MKDAPKKYWFREKSYGYGWGLPCAWQGWLVLAVYAVVGFVGGFLLLKDAPEDEVSIELLYFLIFISFWSASLTLIAYKKGPKPRWRWGNKGK